MPGILVLASASPRRRALLRELGLSFKAISPDVDESPLPGERAADHVRRLARAKARVVAKDLTDGIVVGADTVVVIDGEILGKPRDAWDASRMLARLAGRTHEVLTGVAVIPAAGGRGKTAVVRSRVTMKTLSPVVIRRYVAGGEPLDKAGAYAAQGLGRSLIDAVSGSFTNVVGLPIEKLRSMLAAFGFVLPAAK